MLLFVTNSIHHISHVNEEFLSEHRPNLLVTFFEHHGNQDNQSTVVLGLRPIYENFKHQLEGVNDLLLLDDVMVT